MDGNETAGDTSAIGSDGLLERFLNEYKLLESLLQDTIEDDDSEPAKSICRPALRLGAQLIQRGPTEADVQQVKEWNRQMMGSSEVAGVEG